MFLAEDKKGLSSAEIGTKYGYLISSSKSSIVCELIDIAKNEEKIKKQIISAEAELPQIMSYKKAANILRELKREERGEPPTLAEAQENMTVESVEKGQLEEFLSRYAHALKTTPSPKVERNEIQVAIGFFKRLLNEKHITCSVCGEQHLQWKCGHEF